MALKKTLALDAYGLTLTDAYIRFRKQATVDLAAQAATFEFEVFVSAAAAAAGKKPVGIVKFKVPRVTISVPSAEAAPPIARVAAAYVAVKADASTWPELQGATDV